MRKEDILDMGWHEVETPKNVAEEPKYIPKKCFAIYNMSPLTMSDGFDDRYYMVYGDFFTPYRDGVDVCSTKHTEITIYRHRTGGFAGINVFYPIFIGRSLWVEHNTTSLESLLDGRRAELTRLMLQLGIPMEPSKRSLELAGMTKDEIRNL